MIRILILGLVGLTVVEPTRVMGFAESDLSIRRNADDEEPND